MKTNEKETYWSRFVTDYEQRQSYVTGEEVLLAMKSELLKEPSLGKTLELGCGTGLFTEAISEKASTLRATDFSEEMIETARNLRGTLENVWFEKADAGHLGYTEESFDTVVMVNLIHIVADAGKVLRECKRVLKPEGRIIITSFAMNEMSFFSKIRIAFRYVKVFGKPSEESTREKTTLKQLVSLLTASGFVVQKKSLLGTKTKSFYISAIKAK